MGVRAARTPRSVEGAGSRRPGSGRRPGRRRTRAPARLPAILQAIARTAARLCEAAECPHLPGGEATSSGSWRSTGSEPERSVGQAVPITRELPSGCAVLDGRAIHLRDIRAAAIQRRYPGLRNRREHPFRTILLVPLLRDERAIGLITIRRMRVRPFTAKQVALLQTFADQAAIALENERLREELEGRNRQLTEALEQQTATSDILRVISSSPTDVQPVFDTIVQNVVRLCDGTFTTVFRFDGELIHAAAHHQSVTSEGLDVFRSVYPLRPSQDSLIAR